MHSVPPKSELSKKGNQAEENDRQDDKDSMKLLNPTTNVANIENSLVRMN
jgi:hypothetical protein